MKKQAHYTLGTPIKGSAQAAGFLREDLRALDHEESWILLLNSANLPLAKKMITVGTIKSTQTDRLTFVDENNLPGIGAWLRKNKIASPLGYKERSGFCQYELYAFHHHA